MRLGPCSRALPPLVLLSLGAGAAVGAPCADVQPCVYADKSTKEDLRWSMMPFDKSHKEEAIVATLDAAPRPALLAQAGMPLPSGAAATPAAAIDATERLDDREILQVTHIASQVGIDQARLAKARAVDPRVRQLADATLAQRTDAERRIHDVAKARRIEPLASRTSDEVMSQSLDTVDVLSEMTGREFDRAYVNAQVDTNRRMIQLIDQELAPNAADRDVRALVGQLRPQLRRQLEVATELKQKLDR